MIQEDYVSFEQAKLLKEKGFPQEYSAYYLDNNGDRWAYEFTYQVKDKYAMPTLSLVAKWLREEKKIYIDVTSETNGKWENGIVYEYSIMKRDTYLISDYIIYDIYEKALSEGINKALELIK